MNKPVVFNAQVFNSVFQAFSSKLVFLSFQKSALAKEKDINTGKKENKYKKNSQFILNQGCKKLPSL